MLNATSMKIKSKIDVRCLTNESALKRINKMHTAIPESANPDSVIVHTLSLVNRMSHAMLKQLEPTNS